LSRPLSLPVSIDDVRAAETRLKGLIAVTPCPYSETLSVLTGSRVFVKLENLQMTGSFKERGAANVLLSLGDPERRRGVVAASAGNHGLAVAFHAARLGVSSVIVMPEWAPLTKVTAARRHGAEVILHGDNYDAAYARAREIEAERDLVFIHPFDDPRVIVARTFSKIYGLAGLRIGLLLAVGVIFLLLAANFQSIRLALAIILTIPAVLCGVLLMLRLTATTLNVQSFMGAIMAIGIAVANSILLVTFSEHARHSGSNRNQIEAVQEGATGRLRAVLMTASAMVLGMTPMAIGFGEGGSQSAPLGRAVIGGLIAATLATLVILPSIYAILQNGASTTSPSLNPMDPASKYYEAN